MRFEGWTEGQGDAGHMSWTVEFQVLELQEGNLFVSIS